MRTVSAAWTREWEKLIGRVFVVTVEYKRRYWNGAAYVLEGAATTLDLDDIVDVQSITQKLDVPLASVFKTSNLTLIVKNDKFKWLAGNVTDGIFRPDAASSSGYDGYKSEYVVKGGYKLADGTTEQIAYPIMKKAFERRGIKSEPLLAHSYERVMPGKNYVASIRDFWRVCSGVNKAARKRVAQFLSEVLNTEKYPLTVLDRPIESETAKIIENSYRATILAFLDEWSLFAERNGVDLKKVIEAIKVRPTHSNMIFPGPGIGGYCLPKDGGLGIWAYKHVFGWEDDIFKITPAAIDINDTRALQPPQLVRDALRNMGKPLAAAEILLLGAAYREDVGDTRYSGSEIIVRKLTEIEAEIPPLHQTLPVGVAAALGISLVGAGMVTALGGAIGPKG